MERPNFRPSERSFLVEECTFSNLLGCVEEMRRLPGTSTRDTLRLPRASVHARTVHGTAEQAQFLLSPPLPGSCSSPVASVRAGSARRYRSFDELARSSERGCNRIGRPKGDSRVGV